MTTAPASAATFDELLARAKAEAAAGRNWAPPGDNVTDTIMDMMDLTAEATPEQLSELLALLEAHKATLNLEKTGAAPRDATTDKTASAPPEPNGPTSDRTPAAEKRPMETAATNPHVALISPQSQPPIVGRTPNNPPTVRITRLGPHAAALSQRGRDAERNGDISGARRFYASAAELGDGAAALAVGRLYDPAYIETNTIGGLDADPTQARLWYELAAKLGNAEARPLLEALSVR